tara:strand:- start:55 stop:534 length:480 start_codon:yes stop_codon:yes gene_type:complete
MGGNILQTFDAVSRDIPIKVLSTHFQKDPQILMSHPGAVSTFEALKALGILFIGNDGFKSYYQWLISEFGFSAEKRAPYTYDPAPFIDNEHSAQQGYFTAEPLTIESESGFNSDIWLLADFGFTTYATTVETLQSTIDEHPGVVKCFVEGSSIGWANYL